MEKPDSSHDQADEPTLVQVKISGLPGMPASAPQKAASPPPLPPPLPPPPKEPDVVPALPKPTANISALNKAVDPPTHVYTADSFKPGKTKILGKMGLLSHIDPSVTIQDLTRDKLLDGTQRIDVDGKIVPSIGGIPLFGKLGHSSTASVYYGIRPETRMQLAIKVFPIAGTSSEILARLAEQVSHSSKIQSKFTVGIKEFARDGGLAYITMEFVAGISAQAYLNRIKATKAPGLPEAVALDICIAATEGLAQAHRDGMVHGDVRPANILIPRQSSDVFHFSQAKLADIGIPRIEELGGLISGSNAPMGSPGFMAPEQAVDAKTTRKPADIFSVGATLYTLLVGHPPFEADNPMNAILASIQQQHKPISTTRKDISPATIELIDRCLAKQPNERYVDGSALLEALTVCRSAMSENKTKQASAIKRVTMVLEKSEVGKKVIGTEHSHTPTSIDYKSLGVDPSASKARDTRTLDKRASGPAPLPARTSGERTAVPDRPGTQMHRKTAPAATPSTEASFFTGPVKYLLGAVAVLVLVVIGLLISQLAGGGDKLLETHTALLQQAKIKVRESPSMARSFLDSAKTIDVKDPDARSRESGVLALIEAYEMLEQGKDPADIAKKLSDAEKLMPNDPAPAFLRGRLEEKLKKP